METYIQTIKKFIKFMKSEEWEGAGTPIREYFENFEDEMESKHKKEKNKKWRTYSKKVGNHPFGYSYGGTYEHYVVWIEDNKNEMKEYILEDEGY